MDDKMNLHERLKLEREQHDPITDQMVDDLVALARQKRAIDNKELREAETQVELLLKQRGRLGAMLIEMMSSAGTDKQEAAKNKANLLLNELTYTMSGDPNSAVLSAPGVERVKTAFVALDNDLEARAVMINDFYPRWMELKAAVEALGAPQGSDTLRLDWLTEMFDYIDVYRFIKDGQKTHEHWLNRFFNPNIKFTTLREAIDATINPEPAQPVGGGEAKDGGDNE